jgi:hypothetical protein
MPIEAAQLARSLGALGSLDVDQGLEVTLRQVLGSAKTLLDADRVGLMLIDQAGGLRSAGASDRGEAEAVAGGLSVPVPVDGGPVGTLDVYVTAPRAWDDSAGARSCTRARPDGTSGAARLDERRPSVCRRPQRAAGPSTPTPNSVAPTENRRRPPQR